MDKLITIEDFTPYRQICENINSVKDLFPYVQEAQMFDLRPAIGDAFFYDLLTNRTSDIYKDLLKGKTYTDLQGRTVSFEGLIAALCYFTYARYIENSGSKDTRYGQVVKKNDYSEPISEKTLARKVTNARSSALGYLNDAVKFLQVSFEDYPLWHSGSCESTLNATGGIKISAIGDDLPSPDIYPPSGRYSW